MDGILLDSSQCIIQSKRCWTELLAVEKENLPGKYSGKGWILMLNASQVLVF